MARIMTDEEMALRKSINFHKEVDKANREKMDNPDMFLRYGEKIGDKHADSQLPSNE
jgi:hypothetical protein